MVSEVTLALAQHYLKKHLVPEDNFGLGPFLDSGNYTLYASRSTMLDGSMRLALNGGFYWDCRTIAEGIYYDILANHPELEPRIMFYKNPAQHSWVEIKDPQTGEIIQIDGTPWYAKLNPGHNGNEAPTDKMLRVLLIAKSSGIPVSVKQSDHISVYLHGFLPRISLEEKRNEILRRMAEDKGIFKKARESVELPEYRFILSGVLEAGFSSNEPKDFSRVYIDVLDSMLLQRLILDAKSIDELVTAGALQIGFLFVDGKDSCIAIPFSSLDLMRKVAEKGGYDNIFAEIERNIPRMMLLLKQTRVMLDVYGDNYGYVNANAGIHCERFDPRPRYETNSRSQKPNLAAFLGPDWKRRYEEMLRVYARSKTNPIISITSKLKSKLG